MSAANPIIGAVPGALMGGPDWAPNHASPALSCSDSKYSSRRESPEAINSAVRFSTRPPRRPNNPVRAVVAVPPSPPKARPNFPIVAGW